MVDVKTTPEALQEVLRFTYVHIGEEAILGTNTMVFFDRSGKVEAVAVHNM